jgi:AcrR family transcriptional regulator
MDRRVKYTKNIIKETFLQLLEEKDINKITVSEICKIADINRATFYRYYLDVYDLLEKIENDFTEKMKRISGEILEENYNIQTYAKTLLKLCYEDKKLMTILFNTNNNIYFLNEVLEDTYQKCYDKWIKIPNIDEDKIANAAIFIFNGALGTLNYWVKNDFDKSVEEVASIIIDLSTKGVKNYIHN